LDEKSFPCRHRGYFIPPPFSLGLIELLLLVTSQRDAAEREREASKQQSLLKP